MHLHGLDYVLRFAAPVLQIGVLLAMYRRGLLHHYPWFAAYQATQVLSTALLFGVWHFSGTAYYYSYYVNVLVALLTSVAALFEVAVKVLPRSPRVPQRILLWMGILILLTLAVVLGQMSSAGPGTRSTADLGPDLILLFERDVRAVQVAVLVLLLVFRKRLGIDWRATEFGIVLGFAWFASVSTLTVLCFEYRLFPIPMYARLLSRLGSLAYLLAVGVWLLYVMAAPKPQPRPRLSSPSGPLSREAGSHELPHSNREESCQAELVGLTSS